MFYKWFGYIVLLLVLNGCKKQDVNPLVEIIGHGGNGIEIENAMYHDNSKEAVDLALHMSGVEGVEVDIQLSSSGTLWLYHDDNLATETSGTGCVNAVGDNYLSTLHYQTLKKEKLIRLTDLNFESYFGKMFVLDLRHANFCTQTEINKNKVVEQVQSLIDQYPGIKFKISIHPTVWEDLWEQVDVDVIYEVIDIHYFEEHQDDFDGVKAMLFRNSLISKKEVAKVVSLGFDVYLFDVRAPKRIREALCKNPKGIITDDVRTAVVEKGE